MDKETKNRAAFLNDFRRSHPEPYFDFVNLESTTRLKYEILDLSNYLEIHRMFAGDDNPYVEEGYKDLEQLEEYVDYHLNYHRFSPKRGACDWLCKLKVTNEYIGLINLYDLSRENFNDNHRKCTIGFTFRREYRQQGFAREATQQLISHAFNHFDMLRILAFTRKTNKAAIRFIRSLNFGQVQDKYVSEDRFDFFELWQTRDR